MWYAGGVMFGRKKRALPKRVVFIFVDGIGMRERAADNPINEANCPVLCRLMRDHAVPLDATLSVPGLPQSATGQATIFCGVNVAKAVGRHVSGFPGPKIREMIQQNNLFMELARRGIPCKFANAHYAAIPAKVKTHRFLSVTALMALSVPESLDLSEDRHLNHAGVEDIIKSAIRDRGYAGPAVDPVFAANHLFDLSQKHPFVLFEYFQTDRSGHGKDPRHVTKVLRICDAFMDTLLKRLKRSKTLLVMTSDHGNLEDTSVATHTANPVPLIAIGPGAKAFCEGMRSLCDITPRLLETLEKL